MAVETPVLRREDVPKEQTWNAESVFATQADWQAEFDAVKSELPKLAEYEGKLGDNPDTLANYWELMSAVSRRLAKVAFFARMRSAVNSGDSESKAMSGQVGGLSAQMAKLSAFAVPELLAMGEEKLMVWIRKHERLTIYERLVSEMFRQAKFTQSTEIEQVLGMLSEPFGGVQSAFSELTGTDLEFEAANGSDGSNFPVTQSSIRMAVGHPDREIRRTGWQNYNDSYLKFKNTLAETYLTSVKQHTLITRIRGYDSVLHMKLSPYNLPVDVFHNLIDTFKKNLPTWHRYWEVKRKALGVEQIHPYDIWAPLTQNEPEVSFEQAVDYICEGMKPLGDDYVEVLRTGCLEQRWVDWAVNKGKRQGAFSSGTYDTYSFIMMSFDNQLSGMSTLAHELGHSMHSTLSRKRQPHIYERYSMFAAETASNFNQAMTRAYLFENFDDRNFQLALIQEAMDNFHRYFFIMPTLARFEYEVHERIAAGKPLTADILNGIMSDLFAEGYGTTMTDDPERTGITWATFGHLYNPFYTFQYATGISAAHALADQVRSDEQAAENYLKFLHTGGFYDPLDALKMAGVDMTSPEPVEKAFAVLADLVERLDKLVS
jgi:oligoendopeptidase F